MSRLSFTELREKGAEQVEFVPLQVSWSSPTLDPKRPERRGEPNYDKAAFWRAISDALSAVNVEDPDLMTLALGGFGSVDGPAKLAAYTGRDTVHAFHLDVGQGLGAWVKALCADFGDRPLQLSASSNSKRAGICPGWDALLKDPAPWLVRSAPNAWKARAQADEKQGLIDAAARVAGPPIQSDLTQIAPLWERIVAARNVPVNSGASDADLTAFRETTGLQMPDGLATLLRLSDGAQDAFGFNSLMSVKDITQSWLGWKQIFDDFLIDDLTHHYMSDNDRTVAFYTTPLWIPFADERTGNFAAVDLLPGPKGHKGQIIQFGADEQLIRVIASDIVGYLRIQSANAGNNS